jgi:hypothetical protein
MKIKTALLSFLISSALISLKAMEMDDHDEWEWKNEQTQVHDESNEEFSWKTCCCSSATCLGLTTVSGYIVGAFDEKPRFRPLDSYTETERSQLLFDTTFGSLAGMICFDQLKKFYRQYLQRAPKTQKME